MNRKKNENIAFKQSTTYYGLDEEDIEELHNAFRLFDTDKDGKIDVRTLIGKADF